MPVTILAVDDEKSVVTLLSAVLRGAGYKVLTASDGPEALAVAHSHPGEIDLLVSDIMMPKMTGIDLAEKLQSDHPKIKVILVSGYTPPVDTAAHGWTFLMKPFTICSLLTMVSGSTPLEA